MTGRLLVLAATFFVSVTSAVAVELKFGIEASNKGEPGFATFVAASSLKDADLEVRANPLRSESEVLQALLKGSLDVAAVTIETLIQGKYERQPKFAAALALPFQFEGSEQLFAFQDSVSGEVLLDDINQTGLVPLGYWNKGVSTLVTKQPVASMVGFKGLKVAAWQSGPSSQILHGFGAITTDLHKVAIHEVFAENRADAYEIVSSSQLDWKMVFPAKSSAIAGFRPGAGVFVANQVFWDSLSPSQKKSLVAAAKDADRVLRDSALNGEAQIRKFVVSAKLILLERSQREQFVIDSQAAYAGITDKATAQRQINLLLTAKSASQKKRF